MLDIISFVFTFSIANAFIIFVVSFVLDFDFSIHKALKKNF